MKNFLLSPVLAFGLLAVAHQARSDSIYVTSASDNTIQCFDLGNGSSLGIITAPSLSYPSGLAVDSEGNIYVGNYPTGTISKFSSSGSSLGIFSTIGARGPDCLAFDKSGNLYVTDETGNSVVKISPYGIKLSSYTTGLDGPIGLAFDSLGNLFVANSGNNTIFEFSASGVESLFANTGPHPRGLAFDNYGNLYAAISGNNTIEKFSPTGTSSVFASSGLDNPQSIAFDSSGNLYTANFNSGTIVSYTPEGVSSVFTSNSINNPWGLAIVPEPSTYELFGIGAIGTLMVLRRKRRLNHQYPMKNTILSLLVAVGLIGSASAQVPTGDLANGLVSFYSFNGNANDSVGVNDGVASDITYDFDRFGNPNQTANFNGNSSSYISINNTSLDLPVPFTISSWIKFHPGEGFQGPRIFSTSSYELTTDLSDNDRYIYMNVADSVGVETIKSSVAIPADQWSQITGVWSSGLLQLYINGNLSSQKYTSIIPDYSRWGNATIGVNSGSIYNDNYAGLIDDVAIWNTALSSSQVSQLYTLQLPEPSTYALFGIGAVGLLMVMRRKKAV